MNSRRTAYHVGYFGLSIFLFFSAHFYFAFIYCRRWWWSEADCCWRSTGTVPASRSSSHAWYSEAFRCTWCKSEHLIALDQLYTTVFSDCISNHVILHRFIPVCQQLLFFLVSVCLSVCLHKSLDFADQKLTQLGRKYVTVNPSDDWILMTFVLDRKLTNLWTAGQISMQFQMVIYLAW